VRPGSASLHWLRHTGNGALELDRYDSADEFAKDVTFCLGQGFFHIMSFSLEAVNKREHYLFHDLEVE